MKLYEFLLLQYCQQCSPSTVSSFGTDSLRIDDRGQHDVYPGFCEIMMSHDKANADQLILKLENVPWGEQVEAWAQKYDGKWEGTRTGRNLTVSVRLNEVTQLRRLANSIRNVTGRGRRYGEPSWKWMTERTAKSLERLANHLMEYRKARLSVAIRNGTTLATIGITLLGGNREEEPVIAF